VTCTHCGQPVIAGDAFCEACGGELDTAAHPGAGAGSGAGLAGGASTAGVDDASTGSLDHPRTQLLQPDRQDEFDLSVPCAACGAVVADDGFCSVCGHKARTRREHWTESHEPAGSPGTPASPGSPVRGRPRVGGVCDKGIVHARNEDAMSMAVTADGVSVVVVCDGVTTAPDSDRASLAAAAVACDVLAAAPSVSGSFAARLSAWEQTLTAACRAANAETVAVARSLGDPPEPPSCTFVASIIDRDLIATAWCGDSRAYWLPDGADGAPLTVDHSLGTEMIRSGVSRELAEADPASHTITRWLGSDSYDATPEFRAFQADGPGWLLVCSDGMWNEASTAQALRSLVDRAVSDGAQLAVTIAESLAAHANDCGGHDNITVVLARCEPADDDDRPPTG
jgi:serine/threonine protein phosphatase PrpC